MDCKIGHIKNIEWVHSFVCEPECPREVIVLRRSGEPPSAELPARPPQGMLPGPIQDQEGTDGGRVA